MKMRKNIELIAILMVLLAACLFTACDGGTMEELWKDELGNGSGSGDGPTPPPVPGTYTVSFDMKGYGTQIDPITGVESGAKITKPADPTADGFKFGGWYKETGCTNAWDFASDTVTANTTLYAKWTQATYTVTFDANGHGTAPAPITNVTYGSKITAPASPTEAGYVFGGWYKESGCTTEWDFASDTVKADTTLYAKWTEVAKTFTVKAAAGTDPAVTVKFSPGLLYWDGDSFEFESSQTAYSSSWNANHVNLFFWSKKNSVAVAKAYSDSSATDTDTFFAKNLTIGGETWRTLQYSEWEYLINGRTINGGMGYGYTCKWGTYSGVKGLIIAHDNYTGGFTGDNWEDEAIADGCVFLPAAGERDSTDVSNVGNMGNYWSSTLDSAGDVSSLYFYNGDADMDSFLGGRGYGYCVRLVK